MPAHFLIGNQRRVVLIRRYQVAGDHLWSWGAFILKNVFLIHFIRHFQLKMSNSRPFHAPLIVKQLCSIDTNFMRQFKHSRSHFPKNCHFHTPIPSFPTNFLTKNTTKYLVKF